MDRSLGKRILPDRLRQAGLQVEVHDDHFASDAPDAEWLAEVGKQAWIVLSKDKWIRRRMLERRALAKAGVGAFFFTRGDLKASEMADIFLKALPKVNRLLKKTSKPFIARITRLSEVVLDRERP